MRRLLGVLGNARTKFFGTLGKAAAGGIAEFWLYAQRYQCPYTGVVDELVFTPFDSGLYKYAIYADVADSPGSRLVNVGEISCTAGRQIRVPITPINVVSGAYYWLGGIANTTGATAYAGSTSGGRAAYISSNEAGYIAGPPVSFGVPTGYLAYDCNMGYVMGKI